MSKSYPLSVTILQKFGDKYLRMGFVFSLTTLWEPKPLRASVEFLLGTSEIAHFLHNSPRNRFEFKHRFSLRHDTVLIK
jgi:hypothetical protein